MIKLLPDVKAVDENGNKFVKHVKVKRIISFGWPCEYDLDDLLKDYPFDESGDGLGLCIDAEGRNHKFYPVYITAKDLNSILGQFVDVKA